MSELPVFGRVALTWNLFIKLYISCKKVLTKKSEFFNFFLLNQNLMSLTTRDIEKKFQASKHLRYSWQKNTVFIRKL